MSDVVKSEQPTDAELGVLSFEDTLKRLSAEAESKSSEQDPILPGAPAEVEPPPAAVTPTVPDVQVQNTVAPVTEAKTPQSALIRRKLEQEAELIELRARMKEMEAAKAAPPAAPSPSLDQIRLLYKRDKIAALKALDPNFKPGTVAKEFWYHDLGDLAPKEARAEMEAMAATGSVEAVRAELEDTKTQILAEIEQHKQELAYQQYVGATQAYLQTVPETMPLVQKFAAKKPDKVVQALIGVARKHAQATNGQVLSPEQAAAKLEASLKELQFVDPGTQSAPESVSVTKTQTVAPNTLRNKHTSVQSQRVNEDSMDDEVLRKRALEAIEQAKRQRAARGY